MSPPPPPSDDPPPPPVTPGGGWEVVDPPPPAPARDPILDDPLFAEIVESKPLPELKVEPVAPPPLPVAEPLDALPVAEEIPVPKAAPVRPPRPRPVAPPPPEPADAPKPRVFAACAIVGCFGLGFLGALGFLAYAAIALLSHVADNRPVATTLAGTRPDPVAPTKLAGAKVISLPSTVDAVGRAAGGRFLLLRTPRTREIHVFDPNAGEVIQRFEVGRSDALFAGSASKLFVYNPGRVNEELERWDLTTGQKELTAARPAGVVKPDALVVGAGVDGPVYLVSVPSGGVANARELDPVTLKQRDGGNHALTGWRGDDETRVHVRASDDGTLLGVTTPGGAQGVRFAPRGAPALLKLPLNGGLFPTLATPSPDGRLVFTPVGFYDVTAAPRKSTVTPYCLPTAHGNGLFLSFGRDIGRRLIDPVRVHLTADPEQWVVLPEVAVPGGFVASYTGDLPPDQRVHFWPAAGLALTIRTGEANRQQLDARPLDVQTLLQGFERAYLVIGSEPRLWAERGREWRYRPVVWTSADEATPTVTKVDGPADLQVRNGELVWTPGSGSPDSSDVTLRVSAGGLSAEQKFRLAVLDNRDDD